MVWGAASNFQAQHHISRWKSEAEWAEKHKHPKSLGELFHGASGDFLLTSKRAWHNIRGYPEWCMNIYLDSVGMCQLAVTNVTQVREHSDSNNQEILTPTHSLTHLFVDIVDSIADVGIRSIDQLINQHRWYCQRRWRSTISSTAVPSEAGSR